MSKEWGAVGGISKVKKESCKLKVHLVGKEKGAKKKNRPFRMGRSSRGLHIVGAVIQEHGRLKDFLPRGGKKTKKSTRCCWRGCAREQGRKWAEEKVASWDDISGAQ